MNVSNLKQFLIQHEKNSGVLACSLEGIINIEVNLFAVSCFFHCWVALVSVLQSYRLLQLSTVLADVCFIRVWYLM